MREEERTGQRVRVLSEVPDEVLWKELKNRVEDWGAKERVINLPPCNTYCPYCGQLVFVMLAEGVEKAEPEYCIGCKEMKRRKLIC